MKLGINIKAPGINFQQFFVSSLAIFFLVNVAGAVQPIPDIAQAPLELTPTVSPNVMILFDDSGSMDFEIMTTDVISSGLFNAPHPDGTSFGSIDPDLQINHRPGCELISAAFGGYAYGFVLPTNHYVDSTGNNCYVAAENAWRFRTVHFNKLYFDRATSVVYEPWVGFYKDAGGNDVPFPDFTDNGIMPDKVPLDPFDPSKGTVNLFDTDDPFVQSAGFYDWSDDNGDGLFQNGEETFFPLQFQPLSVRRRFANWFSYYRSRHLRAKALLGKLIESQTGTNIGLVRFNFSNLPSLPAEEMNVDVDVDEKRALLDALYSTTPEQLATLVEERSPLHKRYIETANYLACTTSAVFSGNPDCPAAAIPGGMCQANHIVVASDGFTDRFPFSRPSGGPGGGTGFSNEDGDNSTLFDGGAFADSFERTFSDIAISFYETDLQPVDDEVPVEPVDENRYPTITPTLDPDDTLHQHIKTHILTYTPPLSDSTLTLNFPNVDPTTSFAWQNPLTSDFGLLQDLVHAAYSGRGEHIDSTQLIDTQVQDLAQSIAIGVGSTTPVAINRQIEDGNAVLFRTFYDSSSNSGDLVAQQINSDGIPQVDGSGNPIFMWSAATQLDSRAAASSDSRIIITYSDNSGTGQALRFTYDATSGLDATQQALLDAPQPGSVANPVGEDRLNYLRGQTENEGTSFANGEFRIRPETTSTGSGFVHFAKLGTIGNAAPMFVGMPSAVGRFGGAWPSADGETYFDFQTANANRDPSVLVAANDGMFHMFDAENGNERFAYVPELVFDQLSKLTDPEYNHQYYVDSTPIVEDTYIRSSSSAINPSWNTVVIGGLGAGGRGYYAINITDPADFNDQDNARAQVMWEFGPEDDPDAVGAASDLGLTFGRPLITMSNASDASGNRRWVAIFGNGYNSTSVDGNAVIYMLFIDEGLDGIWSASDLVKIDTGIGGAVDGFTNPNGIADVRGIDTDGDGTVDRLYAGDLRGNLHVVDVRSNNTNDWSSASNRFVLFKAEYQVTGDSQPITTRPVTVRHPTGTGYVVVFATGSYFTQGDALDINIQSIYGVWDDLSGNEVDADTLVEQALSNQTSAFGEEVRIVTDNPVTWGTPGGSNADRGWFIDFDVPPQGSSSGVQLPGERAIRGLQLFRGILFVNSIAPSLSNCEPPPGGFRLALDPFTGSDGGEVIFDINNDSDFDVDDNISVSGQSTKVVGTRFEFTPFGTVISNNFGYTQLSDGTLQVDELPPLVNNFIGRRSWREVTLQ